MVGGMLTDALAKLLQNRQLGYRAFVREVVGE
jgi:hypothetical protein